MCGEMAKVIAILKCLIMISLTSADTVKYNPNDGYLINSNNFTSYKLTVPGSDPITIIESITTKPSSSSMQNDDEQTATDTTSNDHDIESSLIQTKVMQKRNGERFSQKQLVSMISAEKQQQILLQRINDRNNDRKTSMNKTTNSSEPYQTKVKNFMNIYEDQQQQQQYDHDYDSASKNIEGGKMKHDYSPTLLHKFIKDYTEKIKYADQNTKDALSEIESTINHHKSTERSDIDQQQAADDHIEEKYNNNNNWNDYHRKKLSQNQHKDQNPFNDKDGWVTLDAVPWSTSKVSKWHPNKDKFSSNNNYEDDDTPSGPWSNNSPPSSYQQTFPRPPPSRPHYNNEDQGLDYSLDTGRPHSSVTSFSSKPAVFTTYDQYRPISSDRPSYTKPQKYNFASSSFNDRQPEYSSRPTRPHSYDNYHSSQYENNDRYPEYPSTLKPWSEDLITDTRPSNFPKAPPPQPPRRPPTERPTVQAQDRFEYHPYSHPESGNGEWILVSTTKGYQAPSRHGQRAISFQHLIPTNNDITTVHKQVKLTVLPALSNNTFSYDDNRKPMKLSHGGMLEVESTFNTVDESVAAARRNDTVKPEKNSIRRKVYKAMPLKRRISHGQDASAVLAAVGAGMVPATVAMLMPFLGKKRKRSVDDQDNKFI